MSFIQYIKIQNMKFLSELISLENDFSNDLINEFGIQYLIIDNRAIFITKKTA